MEEWRKNPKYRRVEVSNEGNVRTVWDHKVKDLKSMEMKTTVGSYLKVSVTEVDTGVQKQVGIHNLVAEAFVPKPDKPENKKLEPNHEDGNKHNNRADNLTWMTRSENLKHAYATGLKTKSLDENGKGVIDKSKPVKAVNLETQEEIVASSAKEIASITGVPQRTVQYNAFKRKDKKPVRGFLFHSLQETTPPTS